jgi:hypothetical protein
MANHVSTFITIDGTTDIIQHLKEKILINHVNNGFGLDVNVSLSLFSMLYPEWPTENAEPIWPDRSYMLDNVGAKWCFLEDCYVNNDDTIMELSFTSAWDTPEKLFYRFAEYVQNLINSSTSKFEMELTSEDEALLHLSGGYANRFGTEFICDHNCNFIHPDQDNYEDPSHYDLALEEFWDAVINYKIELVNECKQELITY